MNDETNPKDLLGATKPNLHLVPPALTIHTAKAMENGAKKYGPYNWRSKKVRATIYLDGALRHIVSYLDGEERAPDSGVHHLGHAAACLGILLDALETGNLIDDRPTPGKAAQIIERETVKKKTEKLDFGPITHFPHYCADSHCSALLSAGTPARCSNHGIKLIDPAS